MKEIGDVTEEGIFKLGLEKWVGFQRQRLEKGSDKIGFGFLYFSHHVAWDGAANDLRNSSFCTQ